MGREKEGESGYMLFWEGGVKSRGLREGDGVSGSFRPSCPGGRSFAKLQV